MNKRAIKKGGLNKENIVEIGGESYYVAGSLNTKTYGTYNTGANVKSFYHFNQIYLKDLNEEKKEDRINLCKEYLFVGHRDKIVTNTNMELSNLNDLLDVGIQYFFDLNNAFKLSGGPLSETVIAEKIYINLIQLRLDTQSAHAEETSVISDDLKYKILVYIAKYILYPAKMPANLKSSFNTITQYIKPKHNANIETGITYINQHIFNVNKYSKYIVPFNDMTANERYSTSATKFTKTYKNKKNAMTAIEKYIDSLLQSFQDRTDLTIEHNQVQQLSTLLAQLKSGSSAPASASAASHMTPTRSTPNNSSGSSGSSTPTPSGSASTTFTRDIDRAISKRFTNAITAVASKPTSGGSQDTPQLFQEESAPLLDYISITYPIYQVVEPIVFSICDSIYEQLVQHTPSIYNIAYQLQKVLYVCNNINMYNNTNIRKIYNLTNVPQFLYNFMNEYINMRNTPLQKIKGNHHYIFVADGEIYIYYGPHPKDIESTKKMKTTIFTRISLEDKIMHTVVNKKLSSIPTHYMSCNELAMSIVALLKYPLY